MEIHYGNRNFHQPTTAHNRLCCDFHYVSNLNYDDSIHTLAQRQIVSVECSNRTQTNCITGYKQCEKH